MSTNSRNTAIITVLILAVIAVIFLLPKGAANNFPYKNLEAFAQCLTDKGVKMYGAYWCSHCQAQKALFGEAFKKINYIECTERTAECGAAGVNSYPTWIFPSVTSTTSVGLATTTPGQILTGETSLEDLAREGGCVLQKN